VTRRLKSKDEAVCGYRVEQSLSDIAGQRWRSTDFLGLSIDEQSQDIPE
jgi:hypothetical protein